MHGFQHTNPGQVGPYIATFLAARMDWALGFPSRQVSDTTLSSGTNLTVINRAATRERRKKLLKAAMEARAEPGRHASATFPRFAGGLLMNAPENF